MEQLLEKLRSYSRFLELEDSIPYWESQIPELKAKIRELKTNCDGKKIDLQRLENPGFFQRLLHRRQILLYLPTVIGSSFIGQNNCNVAHNYLTGQNTSV